MSIIRNNVAFLFCIKSIVKGLQDVGIILIKKSFPMQY
jgi:hypothetical protein